ncbi:unnamed protein product [Cuscuta campestris]|uniref:Uncharacterized protein n=1 Tax=Cuscuta campestris TaxID=132261 RepID=A0A484MTP1_9ASTE|nr:unnamed protein product [Cuscuta campestris]
MMGKEKQNTRHNKGDNISDAVTNENGKKVVVCALPCFSESLIKRKRSSTEICDTLISKTVKEVAVVSPYSVKSIKGKSKRRRSSTEDRVCDTAVSMIEKELSVAKFPKGNIIECMNSESVVEVEDKNEHTRKRSSRKREGKPKVKTVIRFPYLNNDIQKNTKNELVVPSVEKHVELDDTRSLPVEDARQEARVGNSTREKKLHGFSTIDEICSNFAYTGIENDSLFGASKPSLSGKSTCHSFVPCQRRSSGQVCLKGDKGVQRKVHENVRVISPYFLNSQAGEIIKNEAADNPFHGSDLVQHVGENKPVVKDMSSTRLEQEARVDNSTKAMKLHGFSTIDEICSHFAYTGGSFVKGKHGAEDGRDSSQRITMLDNEKLIVPSKLSLFGKRNPHSFVPYHRRSSVQVGLKGDKNVRAVSPYFQNSRAGEIVKNEPGSNSFHEGDLFQHEGENRTTLKGMSSTLLEREAPVDHSTSAKKLHDISTTDEIFSQFAYTGGSFPKRKHGAEDVWNSSKRIRTVENDKLRGVSKASLIGKNKPYPFAPCQMTSSGQDGLKGDTGIQREVYNTVRVVSRYFQKSRAGEIVKNEDQHPLVETQNSFRRIPPCSHNLKQKQENVINDLLEGKTVSTKPKKGSAKTKRAVFIRPTLSAAQKRSEAYLRRMPDNKWKPPTSLSKLLQEDYVHDPWRVLVICILLNRTTGKQVNRKSNVILVADGARFLGWM